MPCLFCEIVNKEVPAEIIYEDNKFLALKDIKPIAPTHFLIIPKKHIISVNQLTVSDKEIIGELFLVAKNLAKDAGVSKSGYRLVLNTGENAGQTIGHLHLHVLGGKTLPWS